ncbi:hypothetical protein DPMN_140066 [Dreissena polymorpha]|uniref:Uncharacterized protein n=1 Tax=Dreissena polymorpha TaxID=45954 RepID=A0A9D4JIN8_DREPO|nr:hypothetical protein DPMN_140066 [Dreissena polymorpha]
MSHFPSSFHLTASTAISTSVTCSTVLHSEYCQSTCTNQVSILRLTVAGRDYWGPTSVGLVFHVEDAEPFLKILEFKCLYSAFCVCMKRPVLAAIQ